MSILSVKNVNKQFGGLKALNEVNLEIEAGTVHAIIGPNGAGKSTLLNCFVGRLDPDTGSVDFDGVSLLGMQPHEINQVGVSRVFQTPEIFGDLTGLPIVYMMTTVLADEPCRLPIAFGAEWGTQWWINGSSSESWSARRMETSGRSSSPNPSRASSDCAWARTP